MNGRPPIRKSVQLDFDAYLSAQVREAAIVQVDQHADPEWKEIALDIVKQLARQQSTLTSDDVLSRLDRQDATTHDRRALGPVMQRARQNKWIEPSEHFVPSRNVLRHAQPTRVWRSLIYRGGSQ